MSLMKKLSLICVSTISLCTLTSCSDMMNSFFIDQDKTLPNLIIDDKTTRETVSAYSNASLKKGIDSSVGIYTAYVDSDGNKLGSIGSGVIYKILDDKGEEIIGSVPTEKRSSKLTVFVLTNNHVVEDFALNNYPSSHPELRIYFSAIKNDKNYQSGYSVNAKLHGRIPSEDLAVISCTITLEDVEQNSTRSLFSQALTSADKKVRNHVTPSDKVFAVGNPNSLMNLTRVSRGVVTNYNYDVIIHDASVNPGNSGGGLFNAYTGRLIGINTWKHTRPNVIIQRMGAAVSLDIIYTYITTLEKLDGGVY